MVLRLNWHDDANNDLNQIYNYIFKDSVQYSIKTVNDIVDLVNYLKILPYMGRKIPEYDDESKRELIYKSYRIMYKFESNRIVIHIILYLERNLSKQLISLNLIQN